MHIDIISDLHIDQWDTTLENKYPCGKIINSPLQFSENINRILIVAGDISDDLDLSLEYLSNTSKYYKKILFVDGNHEHVLKYPALYTKKEIEAKIKKYNKDNKLIYLSSRPHIENDTVFIGYNGWWNYKDEPFSYTKEDLEYFKDWMPHLDINDHKQFIHNVSIKSLIEYNYLKKYLEIYQNNNNIKNIVIVTHTIPSQEFATEQIPSGEITKDYSYLLNTKFENISKKIYSKLKYWIFGHVHSQYNEIKNNIYYICNPRGRPEDYCRIDYKPLTLTI